MPTATATPTIDARITTRRTDLTKARAERLDPLDYPRTWTQRQVNVYDAETATLDRKIAAFNTAADTLAALPTLDADTKWRDHLVAWRATIDGELLAMPPRIRNEKELELQQRLTFSMRLIDFGFAANRLPWPIVSLASSRLGELMQHANYTIDDPGLHGPRGFLGGIAEVEQRLKALTAKRTAAQAALDLLLRTDEEKAQQDAESAELNAAFNGLHCRLGSDGGHVAHDDYGDVLPVDKMTDIQKRSIERMNAIERTYRQSVIDRQSGRG
jgi:hypothetical protein